MPLLERIGNLHLHSTHSDGTGRPEEIARAARRAGLDFLILTDHNTYNGHHQGWRGRTLFLVGEELHDPARPGVNHFLAFGAGEDVLPFGGDPQALMTAIRARGGLGFIAHPFEHSGPYGGEPDINWTDWSATGYTGLEIWNYMSEFKRYLSDLPHAILYAFWPKLVISGPYPETLAKWDALLALDKVYAVGGSDAHAGVYHVGPLHRQVFSYVHLFHAVNTHILVTGPWSQDAAQDARLVYDALGCGRSFVAYDALARARGFAFNAEYAGQTYDLGSEIQAEGEVRFRITSPVRAHLRLMRNGFCVAETQGRTLSYAAQTGGVYRVEAYRPYLFRRRGWVFTNPIFVSMARDRVHA